jgi:hypothetical protein
MSTVTDWGIGVSAGHTAEGGVFLEWTVRKRPEFGSTHPAGEHAPGDRRGGQPGLLLVRRRARRQCRVEARRDASPIGVPYLRVFLNAFDVTGGDVRYNDDSCDGVAPDQQSWASVVAAHGTDVISGVYVSTGFTGGQDLRAKLTDLSVNGQAFTFGG